MGDPSDPLDPDEQVGTGGDPLSFEEFRRRVFASRSVHSVAQVAEYLGVSVQTVYTWIHQGKIQAEKNISGRYRIRRHEVMRVREMIWDLEIESLIDRDPGPPDSGDAPPDPY